MTKPVVVGICGKARAGKDTAAEMLSQHIETSYTSKCTLTTISPMASAIKLMLGNFLFPFFDNNFFEVDKLLYGDEKDYVIPEIGASPRRMLQTLGTEWGRSINPEIWIKSKQAELRMMCKRDVPPEVVFIPDVRFDNEAKLCDVLVQVVRPHHSTEVPAHASESGIAAHLIDLTVQNDSDLNALRHKMETLWDTVLDTIVGQTEREDAQQT